MEEVESMRNVRKIGTFILTIIAIVTLFKFGMATVSNNYDDSNVSTSPITQKYVEEYRELKISGHLQDTDDLSSISGAKIYFSTDIDNAECITKPDGHYSIMLKVKSDEQTKITCSITANGYIHYHDDFFIFNERIKNKSFQLSKVEKTPITNGTVKSDKKEYSSGSGNTIINAKNVQNFKDNNGELIINNN